jgi:hypothetical protein
MAKDKSETVVFPPPSALEWWRVWRKLRAGGKTAGLAGVISAGLLWLLQQIAPSAADPKFAASFLVVATAGINGGLQAFKNWYDHRKDIKIQK